MYSIEWARSGRNYAVIPVFLIIPVILAALLFSAQTIDLTSDNPIPAASEVTGSNNISNLTITSSSSATHTNIPSSGFSQENEELQTYEIETKGIAVKLKTDKPKKSDLFVENFGKNNPVHKTPPGNVVKYIDIIAANVDFKSAEISIHYSEEELGNVNENTLIILHWNGAAWDALPTVVDVQNKALTATTTSFSPFAVSGGTGGTNKIIVATNRYVILDDWRTGGSLGTGFSDPSGSNHSIDSFKGINTKINATALFIDNNGTPLTGRIIRFELYMPNGTELPTATVNATTDGYGLANFSYDMNTRNYYGNWTVKASNGTLNSTTLFIYNWFGCGIGSCSDSNHNSNNLGSVLTSNSPYLDGRESRANHQSAVCTDCHQSYDGKTGGNTNGGTNHTLYTTDVHSSIACTNTNCHQSYTDHETNAVIGSCYSANCHKPSGTNANRSDISNKSTLNNSNIQIALSQYSYQNGTNFNGTFHTPNSTVPCIICHGPMHNISKPDESQRFIKNTNTEDSQCKTCHASYTEHNSSNTTSGGVTCTLCHSDDVHEIQVFAPNVTGGPTYVYITGGPSYVYISGGATYEYSASRGYCTYCHQDGTAFFNSLQNISKAGTYTGRSPPQVQTPVSHSNDSLNGSKWNSTKPFWDSSNQVTLCKYCHGETNHKSRALGRPSNWSGNNSVNSTIGNTTWCIGCHWQGYINGSSSYQDMINTINADNLIVLLLGYNLSIPPEITGNATYGAQKMPGFYNHSGFTMNDSNCERCHGSLSTSTNITGLMHNVAEGTAGGPDCISCHDIGGSAIGKLVNFSVMNDSNAIHKNLNSALSTNLSAENKKCWACHGNVTQPSNGHPSNYKTPFRCEECHLNHFNLNIPVPILGEHCDSICHRSTLPVEQHYGNGTNYYWNGTTIKTPAAITCYICHNKSEMLNPANDPDNGSGSVYGGENGGNNSPSHYGKKRTDFSSIQDTNDYCIRCHNNVSTVFPFIDQANKTIANHSVNNPATNPACSDCHSTGRIHNQTLTKPTFALPNSSYCTSSSCHGENGSATFNNRSMHNNSVNCTQCHLNTSKSIHPVQYLQNINNTWDTSKTNAVNCTNCHQNATFWSGARIIPEPLKHSSNRSNGSLWNSTLTPFWTTEDGSCYYCHNNTKHNNTALGRISSLMTDANNTRNGSTVTTTWCADCHYNAAENTNYKGNLWPHAPPLITVNNTGKAYWTNHSGYLGSGYKDIICQSCHAINGPYTSTSLNYSHSLDEGLGCTGCHAQPPSGTTRYNMTGAHDLHKNKGYGNVPETSCDYCHATEGRNEAGHPNSNDNANVTTNGSVSIALYTRNTISGNDDTCSGVSCHSTGLSTGAQLGTAIWNTATAGACNECHSTAPSGLPPTGNHTKHYTTENYSCATCHGVNADAGNQTGHKTNGSIDINFTNLSSGGSINGSKACSVYCHSPNPNDPKSIPTWNVSTVTCGNCHSIPPIVARTGGLHPAATLSECDGCHGSGASTGTHLGHIDGVVVGGGGANCISCHDIDGAGAPLNKRINAQSVKLGVHKNLNVQASNVTVVDPINKACWACHGEGIEPSGHPARYQNPRQCSNNDCHALSQLYKAPMVYSHFKDAELNDNPTDVLNYNLSTRSLCEDCHYNSLVISTEPKSNASVSHYASTDKLIESVNCIYCHLDEDNAEDWGNATEINKNRTAMIHINRENNKIMAMTGEMIDLGTGYRIKVIDVSTDRGSAVIEVYKLDTLVDRGLVKIGEYIYEENLVIDNATVKTPIIVLNITDMFVSSNGSFIQFNGSRIKRVHPENRTTSCISCHYKGNAEKHKYVVIDREDEDVYYTELIFNSSDKELYDQEKFQKLLMTLTPLDTYLDIQTPLRTTLKQGAPWDIGKDYKLTLREVATDSKTAIFDLEIGGRKYTDIVRKGEQLDYNLSINYLGNTYTEVALFNATVKEIAQANPNIVILEDVKALSPEIMSVKDNTTLYGYNTSWFWVDNTFMTGKIPQNLHVPLLFDGKVGGPDCVSCHGQKELGKHIALNVKTSSRIVSENKACWICHGDGNESKSHPVTYNKPRVCKSCHADRVEPYYNATYIGDEDHKNVADCSICHVEDTHKIVRFDMMPGIKEISVSKDEIYPGEMVTLKSTAIAGFNMKLKAVEYYIDSPEKKFSMTPVDGSFDGQREDVTAQVNTAGLKAGEHMIYVRAMERNDKWGPESSISFIIKEKIDEEGKEEKKSDGILYGTSGAILSIIIGYSIRKYMIKK